MKSVAAKQKILLAVFSAPLAIIEFLWHPFVYLYYYLFLESVGIHDYQVPENYLTNSDHQETLQFVLILEVLLMACVWYVLCRVKIQRKLFRVIKIISLIFGTLFVMFSGWMSSLAFWFDSPDYEARIMIDIFLLFVFMFFYMLWVDVSDPAMAKPLIQKKTAIRKN